MTEAVALRETTLGQLLDETVARFPDREAWSTSTATTA